eukprot:gene8008-12473_t
MRKNFLKKFLLKNQIRLINKEYTFDYEKFINPTKEKYSNLKRDYELPENYQTLLKNWSSAFLDYEFKNPNLLLDVFVLPSHLLLTGKKPQTTQLAIIGASILNFILSSHTYQQFQGYNHNSILDFQIETRNALTKKIFEEFNFDEIILSKFKDASIESKHLLDSLIGGVYFDSDFETVYNIIETKILPHFTELVKDMEDIDYVIELENYLKDYHTYADYRFVEKNIFYRNIPKKAGQIAVGVFVHEKMITFAHEVNFTKAKYLAAKQNIKNARELEK